MGLSPLETLMAIWAGLRLFGFLGFILGPVGLLLIEDLVAEYDREQPASEAISHGGEKGQPEDKKLRGEERM